MSKSLLIFMLFSIVYCACGHEPDQTSTATKQRPPVKDKSERILEDCPREKDSEENKNYEIAVNDMRMFLDNYITFADVEFMSNNPEDISRALGRYCDHAKLVTVLVRSLVMAEDACAITPADSYRVLLAEQIFLWVKDYACENSRDKTTKFIIENGIKCFLKKIDSIFLCTMDQIEVWDFSKIATDSRKYLPGCMDNALKPCE